MTNKFRRLPSVDRLLAEERIKGLVKEYPHDLMVSIIRQYLEKERQAIAKGKAAVTLDGIVNSIQLECTRLGHLSLRPVINATGVILHTNLGRASLSYEAIAAMEAVARNYCNLEFDLDSGDRGSRDAHLERVLCQLTGAEAAVVVNNNAAAVLLALTALGRRKEVIVSRGEAVEIGGGFRITDIMRQSGAKLVEVGSANCTYITDYEEAITPRTAALLRVHASNFRVVGFTHAVTMEEIVELGRRHNLPVIDNLGSGGFLDTTTFGLGAEPMVQQSMTLGAGLACFSGDKLVGGPQAGIIVGEKKLIDKLKKHPLARAVRIDKVRLAGLGATLIHYVKGEVVEKIPVWIMIATPLTVIEKRAKAWVEATRGMGRIIDGESMVGGGSLPGSTLPTKLVAIGGDGKKKGGNSALTLAQRLRRSNPPVIGRISEDVLLLDPRAVLPEEDKMMVRVLRKLACGE